MKTLIKSVKAAFDILNNEAKQYFAPFVVVDNFGTNQLCWSMKSALAWLPYCSDRAYILETYNHAPVVKRIQGA
jgi:hypothetical protein